MLNVSIVVQIFSLVVASVGLAAFAIVLSLVEQLVIQARLRTRLGLWLARSARPCLLGFLGFLGFYSLHLSGCLTKLGAFHSSSKSYALRCLHILGV